VQTQGYGSCKKYERSKAKGLGKVNAVRNAKRIAFFYA
jgi:hypothetical protein